MLHPPLTDQTYLQSLLKKHGIKPAHSAGQNFLVSAEVVEATLALLTDGPTHITELGAGAGTLTQALLQSGFTVRAIERDQALASLLPHALGPKERARLDLSVADMREVDWTHPKPYQLVGNIPYNLSGLIIRRLTELDPAPTAVVLLVQREVAQRLVAAPPDMGISSVAIQLWGQATIALQVPADCFWPRPAVDSSLVSIIPHPPHQRIPAAECAHSMQLVRAVFKHRRKQLGTTLPTVLNRSRDEVAALLSTIGHTTMARPQELSAADWVKLYKSTINN